MLQDHTRAYLDDLNDPQREAVLHEGGPLLIIAGAGSGKTRVLTHRIAHLVGGLRVNPREILAITFTNKAAGEMKERVRGLVGIAAEDMTLGTFHSACARILRREIGRLGYSTRFSIFDEIDSMKLVADCQEELGIDRRCFHPRALRNAISAAKNDMVDHESYLTAEGDPFNEAVDAVYRRYQERLKENSAVDFDDLLLVTVNLLELFPEVLTRYRERYRHVLVDEYQDTNMVQYRLVRMLAEQHRDLSVVGDDDQGIYSWRGATIRNILEFEKDYPDARVIKLEQNYRSTSRILEAAGAVVSHNRGRKPKSLWTGNPGGTAVRLSVVSSEHQEAALVARDIAGLVRDGKRRFGDFAVFYRTHAQSRVIEERMIREGIPYRVFGGTRFYERKEIKDTIAFLRVISNPLDAVSLLRIINVPPRKIGAATVSRLVEHGRDTGTALYDVLKEPGRVPGLSKAAGARVAAFSGMMEGLRVFAADSDVTELLEEVWRDTGYIDELEAAKTLEAESRVENLRELLGVVEDFRGEYGAVALEDFLERVSLVNDTDGLDEGGGYVSLMTLHNAKGLEFPAVFVVGMEEGLFPHVRSGDTEEGMEEERRLCYVGMTRAMETLCLTRAAVRSSRGVPVVNLPSRFLAEIPGRFIDRVDFEEERLEAGAPLDLIAGERVVHRKWGPGVVLAVDGGAEDGEIAVSFEAVGEKRLLLKYAPLIKEEA